MSTEEQKKQVDLILERVRHELLAIVLAAPLVPSEPAKPAPDGMMGITRACEYLECSETHIRQMVKEGLLPERRVGNRLRFKPDELDRATVVKTRLQKVV